MAKFRERTATRHLVIHCTGSDDDAGVREIQRKHRAQGLVEIGYHFVIRRNGLVETGREKSSVVAIYKPADSVFICCAGATTITPEQALSLRSLLNELLMEYPEAQVLVKSKLTNFKHEKENDEQNN